MNAAHPLEVLGVGDPLIEKLVFDSREAGPGVLFFALPGTHTDGHHYLAQAAAQGARAFVVEKLPETPHPEAVYLRVSDSRFSMSPIAAAFYNHPSRDLKVIGVTGTDGKSTTVSFIRQLLEGRGKSCGFFSTVEWKVDQEVLPNPFRQSTPEAPQIQDILNQMRKNGLEYAVVESTSHGLSPRTNRLGDVLYDTAVFTNVTLEHLEFHGTVENYRLDKTRLFSALDRSGKAESFGVINFDSPHQELFRKATEKKCFYYSMQNPSADLWVSQVRETQGGIEFKLHYAGAEGSTRLEIPGLFNLENLMAALLAVGPHLNLTPLDFLDLIPRLRAVKGRMTPVKAGQDFLVLVDYAHTPGAFEKLLPAVKSITPGRLLVVFGSGGERDQEKRPLQGLLADRWADYIILTDEDPRLENPQKILTDIQAGIQNKTPGEDLFLIRPRPAAIAKAFSLAQKNDTVLLLGKGHEQCIITPEGKTPYDEESAALEALKDLLKNR